MIPISADKSAGPMKTPEMPSTFAIDSQLSIAFFVSY